VLIAKRRWSLKASQEAIRLLGPEYVNIATDARKINDGKFGKIPDESTWELSNRAAMVYLCENEVHSSLFGEFLLIYLL
jgi:phosphoserine aminotransferase